MTLDDLMAERQAQETEMLRQRLQASPEELDQLMLATDPKFQTTRGNPSLQPDMAMPLEPVTSLSGWQDDPTSNLATSGLGITGRQINPPSRSFDQALAEAALGPGIKLGALDRMTLSQAAPSMLANLAQQRQMSAYQQAELKAKQEESEFKDLFGIATNKDLSYSQRVDALKERGKQSSMAARLSHGLTTRFLGELDTYGSFLPRTQDEYREGIKSGAMSIANIEADLEVAKETQKLVQGEMKPTLLEQNLVKLAQGKPPESPEAMALKTFRAKRQEELTKANITEATAPSTIAGVIADTGNKQADLKARQNQPKEVYSGVRGPQGESVTGIYDPRTGMTREMTGTPIQRITDTTVKMTVEESGKFSAAFQAIDDLNKAETTLFKDDGSVNRDLMFKKFINLPFSKGRDITRWIDDAINAKALLQSGVTVREDERANLHKIFDPAQLDDDATIRGKLQGLRQFMMDAVNFRDPTGEIRARVATGTSVAGPPPIPFEQAYQQIQRQNPSMKKEDIFKELRRRGVRP